MDGSKTSYPPQRVAWGIIMPKDPVPCVSVFTKWFPALHKFIWLIEMCKGGVHPYTKRTQKPKPLCKVSQLKVEFHHRKAMCNHNQNL